MCHHTPGALSCFLFCFSSFLLFRTTTLSWQEWGADSLPSSLEWREGFIVVIEHESFVYDQQGSQLASGLVRVWVSTFLAEPQGQPMVSTIHGFNKPTK